MVALHQRLCSALGDVISALENAQYMEDIISALGDITSALGDITNALNDISALEDHKCIRASLQLRFVPLYTV